MTAPVIRRTLVRLPADPARTDVKLGQRAPYEGEWVERAGVTNEAAERLRTRIGNWPINAVRKQEGRLNLDEAIAAERRTTVERIRTAALAARKRWGASGLPASLEAILDAEAER